MYPIRNLIAIIDTKKATNIPMLKTQSSFEVIFISASIKSKISNKLAPAIAGIAKINVNSDAATRETPKSKAPKIVAPERLVPGKAAAKS